MDFQNALRARIFGDVVVVEKYGIRSSPKLISTNYSRRWSLDFSSAFYLASSYVIWALQPCTRWTVHYNPNGRPRTIYGGVTLNNG